MIRIHCAPLALFAPLALLFAACGAPSDDLIDADLGSDDLASENTASDDTASDDSASENTASDDTASDDMGSADSASENTASDDTASDDMGSADFALASAPSLGAASQFAALGASTVTCANSSSINGAVGVSPGIALTGFGSDCSLTGATHAGDALAVQAHADLFSAYDALQAAECEHDLTGQDLGGQKLAPGVYCFDTSAGLTGALTLDGRGESKAVWIFQVGSAMTTATSSSVSMAGSGRANNVFWQVGSSATLSTGTAFVGNVLALASITLVSGAQLNGRALALNAAVTLDHNNVSLPQ